MSAWTNNCKKRSLVFLLWWKEVFSIKLLRGILVCSLDLPLLFIQMFPDTNSWEILMQSNSSLLVLCVSLRDCFPWKWWWKNFDYFWKPISPFSRFFSMSNGFWCSSPFTAAVVLWMLLMQPKNALACGCSFWWYKHVSGTWTQEKDLNFLRFTKVLDLVLKWCSDVNEGNWIHFSFSSLCCWIDLSSWLEWVFSYLAQVSVGIFP